MNENYEEILIEIAKKHGVALNKNDPILIVYTLNQRMIADQTQAQEALFDNFRSQMEELTQNFHFETKSQAEKILTASLDSSKKVMLNAMNDNAKAASTAVREEIDSIVNKVQSNHKESRQTSYINLFSSILTLTAACVILYAFFKGG